MKLDFKTDFELLISGFFTDFLPVVKNRVMFVF